MKGRIFPALILVLLLALCQIGLAEQPYIDLSERFGNQETYQYGGETYYLKNRVNTTLVLCANLFDDEGVGDAEMILLLPVDDDAKYITPIQLDGNMFAAWLEGDAQSKTLRQLFAEAESAEAACESLMDALNELFPTAVIEHYALFDLRGLPVLDGVENNESNVSGEPLIERMKAIKRDFEQSSNANVNDLLSKMSGYIITDMKSGAMMKLVDKSERYDRSSRMPFPVKENAQEAEKEVVPDLDAFEKMMVDVYYGDNGIW